MKDLNKNQPVIVFKNHCVNKKLWITRIAKIKQRNALACCASQQNENALIYHTHLHESHFIFYSILFDLKQIAHEMMTRVHFWYHHVKRFYKMLIHIQMWTKYVKIAINNDRLKHFNVDSVAICQIKLEYLRWNEIERLLVICRRFISSSFFSL